MMAIKCKCLETFRDVNSLIMHIKNNSHHEKTFFFQCMYPDCGRQYGPLKSLKSHLKIHNSVNLEVNTDHFDNPLTMPIDKINPISIENENPCIENICKTIDDNVSNDIILKSTEIEEKNFIEAENSSVFIETNIDSNDNTETLDSRNVVNFGIFQNLLQESIFEFTSQLHGNYNVPRNCVQKVIEDVQKLFSSQAIDFFEKIVLECLNQSNSNESQLKMIETMFKTLKKPITEFNTEFKRFQNFKRDDKFVLPVDVVIGSEDKVKSKNNKSIIERVNVVHQYFPIGSTLKNFFEMDSVFEEVTKYTEYLQSVESKEIISNFIQGELWKKIASDFPNKKTVPYILYTDDCEVNNPLSVHAGGSGKLCGLYMSLPTLPPKFQAKVNNIFVVQIFQAIDRKIYGNKSTYRRIINDILDLANNGITIETDKGDEKLYFVMALLKGDNLGLNEALGFVTCFNANYYCRICEMPKAMCRVCSREIESYIRTKDSYNNAVSKLDLSQTHSMGITENSIWNELPWYHVVENIYLDELHDGSEGQIKRELGQILHYMTHVAKIIGEDTLNNRLESFDFGENCKRNRPPDISPQSISVKKELKMSASETLCLLRHLGLLIGDLIPIDNPVWEVYITLNELNSLMLATTYHKNAIELLETLISEHFELYMRVLNKHMLPKSHFRTHYPRFARACGPPVKLWTMREESKHQCLKQIANSCKSRVNISKTLSLGHALKHYNYVTKNITDRADLLIGPTQLIDLKKIDCFNQICNQINPLILTKVYVCKWVEYHGARYKPGGIVQIIEDDGPIFFNIIDIFLDDNKEVFFTTHKIHESQFDRHFQAHEIIYIDIDHSHTLYLKHTDGIFSKSQLSNKKWYICAE